MVWHLPVAIVSYNENVLTVLNLVQRLAILSARKLISVAFLNKVDCGICLKVLEVTLVVFGNNRYFSRLCCRYELFLHF